MRKGPLISFLFLIFISACASGPTHKAQEEESVPSGDLDETRVIEILGTKKTKFQTCYFDELKGENKKMAGRLVTHFVIGTEGRVTEAKVHTTSLKNQKVEDCVLGVIKTTRFPKPKDGTPVNVAYPFEFGNVKQGS